MKNIIIAGPARSGKSTLANKIGEQLGYYVMSTDKLAAVFGNAYPDLGIRLNWNRDMTTKNLAPFLGHYLGTFASPDGRGLLGYSHGAAVNNRLVLEGAYYDPGAVEEILGTYGITDMDEHFILIGLVQMKKTAEDFFADFRKYDTADDWTYSLSDGELMEVAKDSVQANAEMHEKLVPHGFRIYDTSDDRNAVLERILDDIRAEI